MPVSAENIARALIQVQDILNARIRYNQALAEDVAKMDEPELMNFFYSIGAVFRDYLEPAKAKGAELFTQVLERLRTDFRERIQNDINLLQGVQYVLEGTSSEESTLVESMHCIQKTLAYEQYTFQATTKDQLLRKEQIKRKAELEARAANAKSNLSDKQKQQRIKSAIKAALDAELSYDYTNSSELFVFKQIKDLLYDVCGPMACQYVDIYTELWVSQDEYNLKPSAHFEKLINRNIDLANSLLKTINQLSDAYSDLKARSQENLSQISEFCTKDNEWLEKQTGADWSSFDTQNIFQIAFLTNYEFKDTLRALRDEIEAAIKEELEFKRAQQAAQAAAARKAEQEAKKEEQSRRASARLQQKQAVDKAAQNAAEQQKRADKQSAERAAENARIVEENKVRQEKLNRELAERKEQIEAQRQLREQEKQALRAAIVAAQPIREERGKLISEFRISEAVVEANRIELEEIFAPDFKSISFKKACALIKHLGGKVVANAGGSSHNAVVFGLDNGTVYTYIEDQGKKPLTVGGLPRPHDGETKLYNFELRLLLQSIASVLPDRYVAEFNIGSRAARVGVQL